MTLSVAAGTLIDGRYRVVSRVGSGGMADVYCAEDVQLGRRVAVKLLHERFAADEEFVERFRREASSAASLSHANIVSVYDRGEWSGTYYIVMEYLDGRSLDSIVREEAPLGAERAIEITEQVLRAARFAHRRGVVHRDLKPHNVILDEEGRVKVTDFGIARAGASEITQTGSILGTARYLSPEQAQGQPVSPPSDLYAVGIMLYELLTGSVPFEGDSVIAIALRHLSEPPRPPSSLVPSVSAALDAIVLRALAKNPEARFEDADEFLAALENERARIRGESGAHTAALAPVVVAPPAPPLPARYPATYATQALAPVTGPRGPGALAWWDPNSTGNIPPGAIVQPAGGRERGPAWPWVLLAVVVAAAAAVAVVLLLAKPPRATPVTPPPKVPGVIGLGKEQADARILAGGYLPLDELRSAHRTPGTIVGQSPAAGQSLGKNSTVVLFVSTGPAVTTAQVPNVLSAKLDSAIHQLHRAGFKVSTAKQFSTTVPDHMVISTNPPAGSSLAKGSTVLLVYSGGPPPTAIPNVVGETLSVARPVLQARGFRLAIVRRATGTSAPGTVLAQSPAFGKAPLGSAVTLTVAKALPNVAVPNLLGTSLLAADQELAKLGLIPIPITVIKHVNPQYDGRVLHQSPVAGSRVPPQTQVTIRIEQYQPPAGPTGTTTTTSTSSATTTTTTSTSSATTTTGATAATGATG